MKAYKLVAAIALIIALLIPTSAFASGKDSYRGDHDPSGYGSDYNGKQKDKDKNRDRDDHGDSGWNDDKDRDKGKERGFKGFWKWLTGGDRADDVDWNDDDGWEDPSDDSADVWKKYYCY